MIWGCTGAKTTCCGGRDCAAGGPKLGCGLPYADCTGENPSGGPCAATGAGGATTRGNPGGAAAFWTTAICVGGGKPGARIPGGIGAAAGGATTTRLNEGGAVTGGGGPFAPYASPSPAGSYAISVGLFASKFSFGFFWVCGRCGRTRPKGRHRRRFFGGSLRAHLNKQIEGGEKYEFR